jgi:hypothetical protein
MLRNTAWPPLTIPARKHKRTIHPQYRKMIGYLSINVLPAIFAMVLVTLFITVATNWNPSSCRDGYREVQRPVKHNGQLPWWQQKQNAFPSLQYNTDSVSDIPSVHLPGIEPLSSA